MHVPPQRTADFAPAERAAGRGHEVGVYADLERPALARVGREARGPLRGEELDDRNGVDAGCGHWGVRSLSVLRAVELADDAVDVLGEVLEAAAAAHLAVGLE